VAYIAPFWSHPPKHTHSFPLIESSGLPDGIRTRDTCSHSASVDASTSGKVARGGIELPKVGYESTGLPLAYRALSKAEGSNLSGCRCLVSIKKRLGLEPNCHAITLLRTHGRIRTDTVQFLRLLPPAVGLREHCQGFTHPDTKLICDLFEVGRPQAFALLFTYSSCG
jgi:hypothetical protein